MIGRGSSAMLAAWLLAFPWPATAQVPKGVDVRPRPMDWIAPGTVIGPGTPKGWSDLVLFVVPRIGAGDVQELSKSSAGYASMVRLTILANVVQGKVDGQSSYGLERVGIGIALEAAGRNVIATSDETFGADLGIIGRAVLSENEKILKADVRQVARTPTMLVFDMNLFVARAREHRAMILRHAIAASPTTGKLSTFVWLLNPDGGGGYALADRGLQKLPPSFREDRVLSVDGRKFTFGIPSNDAFALAKIPQGTSLGFSDALRLVAASKAFTPDAARKLEAELQLRYAPVADRPPGTARAAR